MQRAEDLPSDRELVARIARSAGEKAGYKQLVRELGLGGGRERRLLLEQLGRLVQQGRLQRTPKHLWAIPTKSAEASQTLEGSKSNFRREARPFSSTQATSSHTYREHLISGRLDLHRDGFGFVRQEPAQDTSVVGGDVFIAPNAIHGAMHGDLVLVQEEAPDRTGRRSGRIARVLTRRHQTLVGTFHYARRRRTGSANEAGGLQHGNYVQPWDDRLGSAIEIPLGAELGASIFSSPHRTLGEDAALTQRPTEVDEDRTNHKPLEGLVVEVEITSFAQPGRPAQGRVLEILGPPDGFGVDVEIIIRKHAIPHTFPAHVLAEADERAQLKVDQLPHEILAQREDFRGLPVITIDGETARDFDDAVFVRPLSNGLTELQVHIADVSHYVEAASALDVEARMRGTSVYFPDRAVPMLPHALSSGMCSLLPQEDRLVLSCVMEVDPQGEIAGFRIAEGVIRSARRMTYTSVQQCLNASPGATRWNAKRQVTPEPTAEDLAEREHVGLEQPELPAAVDGMLELALRLNAKRVRRGSIDFDLPEPVVAFDPDGNMKAIVRSERGWAHRLIEEFMLSANECVATWLAAQGTPSIYRVHELPDPKRILEFEETAAAFGQTLGLGAVPVKRLALKGDRREAQRQAMRGNRGARAEAHEIPERLPVTPQMYQRLIGKIAGKPEERILSYLMLRSLKQARYAEKNEGHFALASPCYTHFTSPIRRYPDLVVHRLLREHLRRGVAGLGGPVMSTDAQPWEAERQRARGQHTVGHQVIAAPTSAMRSAARQQDKATESQPGRLTGTRAEARQRKHSGRIGWSGGGEGTGPGRFGADQVAAATETAAVEVQRATPGALPSAEDLSLIALESSQAERRAAEAERELIEWKKMKFMADKIGQDFVGLILSVTKFGFFVELDELFVDGLVPLASLSGDFYSYRDADRAICGARGGHCFRVGDRVEVILDRIDRQQHRLQFALLPGTEPKPQAGTTSLRKGKSEEKKARAEAKRHALAKERKHKRKLRKRG